MVSDNTKDKEVDTTLPPRREGGRLDAKSLKQPSAQKGMRRLALALAPWCGAPDWTELAHPDKFLQLRASPAYGKRFPCPPSQRPR